MKQFIRQRTTGKYLALDGQWTLDVRMARQFKNIRELLQTVNSLKLSNVEELLQFGETPSQWDVALPITDVRR
jgi:hypothetical protein